METLMLWSAINVVEICLKNLKEMRNAMMETSIQGMDAIQIAK